MPHQVKQRPSRSYNLSKVVATFLRSTGRYEETHPIFGSLRAQDWRAVLAAMSSPHVVTGVAEYRIQAQIQAFLKKYPFTSKQIPGLNPRGAAVEKFKLSELRMRRVNARFRHINDFYAGKTELKPRYRGYLPLLNRAQAYVRRVLGEVNLAEILSKCDWSGGASLGVHGACTNWGRKALAETYTCTPTASTYFRLALRKNHHLSELFMETRQGWLVYDMDTVMNRCASRLELVQHNKICFVPKTFDRDRTIAIEPSVNNFLQKGVDLYMREKLRRVQIDLTDQTRNQTFARIGSRTGRYSTIDLSMASDTLSKEVCRFLLPPDWYRLLDDLRSHSYELDGEIHRYEKFVSMGNGFCFPLETLMFAAIVYAAGSSDSDRCVYGDDIIVPTSQALITLEYLGVFGFRANRDKTYIHGPFRESCGADWYLGQDVRPVYLRTAIDAKNVYTVHNSLQRSFWVQALMEDVCTYLRNNTPPSVRYVHCSQRLGAVLDGAFDVAYDVVLASPLTRYCRNLQRLVGPVLMEQAVRDKARHDLWRNVEYIAFLRGSPSEVPLAQRFNTKQRLQKRRLVA